MKPWVRGLAALAISALLAWSGIALMQRGVYGLTLFVVLPALMGGFSTWVFRPQTAWQAAKIGAVTLAAATGSLLLLGLEGMFCIVMALPLTMALGAFGGWFAYQATDSRLAARGGAVLLVLMPPAGLMWDTHARPPDFEVRSEISIAATPEQVWKHVVSFAALPEPEEWYFRTGLAYPMSARIEGTGPGAIRYCQFSTGPFVEPIVVWDAPRLLQFSVTQNPAPMNEWSPYAQVLPKHLHGYLVSKRGQFRLIPLPGNRTRLEGTTWYQHGLWPSQYWRWWSDAIIHRIHARVLNHIRTLAEADAAAH